MFSNGDALKELSVAYRQNTDINFSQLLERVEYGDITDNDYDTLFTRRYNILDKEEQDRFNDAIFTYPTNDSVKLKN